MSPFLFLAAKDLRDGDRLNEADDSNDAVVLSSIREEHPEGIAVYNFEVEGDHTYFVEDGIGAATAVWVHNTCAGLNHFVPRAMGSLTPYGHSSLTFLNQFRHTKLHRRLNDHLLRQTKTVKGFVLDMMPRRGNSGRKIQRNFTLAEREAALDSFYRTYNNGEYYSAFLSDLSVAKSKGWWR